MMWGYRRDVIRTTYPSLYDLNPDSEFLELSRGRQPGHPSPDDQDFRGGGGEGVGGGRVAAHPEVNETVAVEVLVHSPYQLLIIWRIGCRLVWGYIWGKL